METLIFNERTVGLYQSGGSYYFILNEDNDDFIEGEIVIGNGEHGGETYSHVSHVEFSSDDELDEVEQEEFETYLDNHLIKIFNSERI